MSVDKVERIENYIASMHDQNRDLKKLHTSDVENAFITGYLTALDGVKEFIDLVKGLYPDEVL